MKAYTKENLIETLKEIRHQGWIATGRKNNDGGIGNTLEYLLGIEENNLPLPNAAEWELKAQKKGTTSLVTLFHMEPSPRAFKFIPSILLPEFGWKHKEAGTKYPATEKSFRKQFALKNIAIEAFQFKSTEKKRKYSCLSILIKLMLILTQNGTCLFLKKVWKHSHIGASMIFFIKLAQSYIIVSLFVPNQKN